MAINKVEANGETLIDLTSDTVTADTLVSGRTAHLASGEQVTGTFEPVTGVKGNAESTYRKGNVNLTPANIGLGNVNNTSDADKPISTAAQTALDGKVDVVSGKGLSTNDYTTTEKTKLAGIATGAEVNQNAFSNVVVGATTIAADGKTDTLTLAAGSNITLTPDATNDKVTIAASQPTVNNGTLTIQKNGTNVATFTANQAGNTTANITLAKADVGLTNVDNTSDANKPISTAAQAKFDMQQAQIDKALIPQGDYNIVSVDGGLNFETTEQTTLEVTGGDIVLISNNEGNDYAAITLEVNDKGHTCSYYFTKDGLEASIPIAEHEDSRVSLFELIPRVNSNHNGIFRGEDLTNVWVENGKIKEALYTRVHSGNFLGLYLGDYFTVSITTDIYTKFTGSSFVSGTTYYTLGGEYPNWDYTATTDTAPTGGKMYFTKQTVTEIVDLMIAAFDYYYNVGDTALTSHHLVLIPRNYGFKTTAKMNSTNTTAGSYYNCEMHQFTLPCYARSFKTALNNHLLAHRTILPNAINASTPSMAGAGFTGASNAWAWETVELQLMSEPQIYGTTVWSSSAYDVGADYKKLPVFDFINGVQFGHSYYWLRSVVSSTTFALCNGYGHATSYGAGNATYVRPLILFG